jgi:SnoaL-like domain
MLATDEATLWYALSRLLADYWAEVDHNGGKQAHEFYFPTAPYAVGENRFEGTEKIRAFYARRRQFGDNTTRHVVENIRILPDDRWRARALGVMILYRADGRPPIQRVRPPAMIADFEARCGLADEGVWRFESHLIRPIFISSDLPASISIDPQRL